jgi:hypothetical protein
MRVNIGVCVVLLGFPLPILVIARTVIRCFGVQL